MPNRVERLSRIDAVRDDSPIAIAIVVLGYCFVLLLSCRVPYLQFDPESVNRADIPDIINANCHYIIINKFILSVADQQRTLTHSRISYYYDLHRVIKIG